MLPEVRLKLYTEESKFANTLTLIIKKKISSLMTGKREKYSLPLLKDNQNLPRYQEITELCIDNQGISLLKKKKKARWNAISCLH